jgi:hypothetical protein
MYSTLQLVTMYSSLQCTVLYFFFGVGDIFKDIYGRRPAEEGGRENEGRGGEEHKTREYLTRTASPHV